MKFLFVLLNKLAKNKDNGFSLIELAVVIIIIGILSSIALPTFLSQSSRARESEAKQILGAFDRAQQRYYAETGTFVIDITEVGKLGIGGIRTRTNNYVYSFSAIDTNPTGSVVSIATPVNNTLRAYVNGIGAVYQPGADVLSTLSRTCMSNSAGVTLSTNNIVVTQGTVTVGDGDVTCAGATTAISQ